MAQAATLTSPSGEATGEAKLGAVMLIPLAGVVYALIGYPLLLSGCSLIDAACLQAPRPENRIVWPLLSLISAALIVQHWNRFFVPYHMSWLIAFVGFAGLSVVWAFRPEISFVRYTQQVMVVTAVALPCLIQGQRGDLMRGLFYCFAAAALINVFYTFGPPPVYAANATPGEAGYFAGKNYLGLCAGVTVLLSLHEMMQKGARRWLGVLVCLVAVYLLSLSNAKTSTGLVLICPVLAAIAVIARRAWRMSILILPLLILTASLIAILLSFDIYKLSYWLYGESTFTGRRYIWTFASYQIERSPLIGWGYQSFWLVGPDGPSMMAMPRWVRTMPNAHNGYIDTTLEMGFVGLFLLLMFVASTLHAASHLVDRDPKRGWAVVTIAFFVIMTNLLEAQWMRAFEFIWLVFLILAVEVARSCPNFGKAQGKTGSPPLSQPVLHEYRPR